MRIQYFNGGLANQAFQYIFMRYAQITDPGKDVWFLDDSFFYYQKEHNGYELEKVFGVKPNLLSSQFDKDAWDALIENRKKGISITQSFLDQGFDIKMITENLNYRTRNPFYGTVYTIPCNEYHPEILNVPGSILYYYGYWITNEWFDRYRDQLLEELHFPPIPDETNLKYASMIKSSFSVGVHIRRGDYITLNWQLSSSYYLEAAKGLIENYPDLTFFVFSDDLDWCEQHADELGFSLAKSVIFVRGNRKEANYIDMQLMSMCCGLLMSNSAFCYLAGLLDTSLQFYINPLPYRKL